MATTIRLTRMGRKKRPFYRLVVLDSRKRRDGAYLANLGYYNPFAEPAEVDLHTDEIISWLGKGATLSETARSLLRAEGVLFKFSLVKQGLEQDAVEAKVAEWRQGAEGRKQGAADAASARRQAERDERDRREVEAKAKAAETAAAAAAAAAAGTEAAAEATEAAADEPAAEDGEN
ncbi:MAG: 30S ribosomal protein S16 [Candidatus Krumholzibacteriia bacterium]